jgi:hypothetical protein
MNVAMVTSYGYAAGTTQLSHYNVLQTLPN